MNLPLRACVLAVLLVLPSLTGCRTGHEKPRKSPFAGTYSGQFSFKASNPNFISGKGRVTLFTITADGKVTGKFNAPGGQPGDFTGSVDEDGGLKYTIEFSNQSYFVKGTVAQTKNGNLKGTLTQYFGKDQPVGSVEFDLLPK